MQAISRQPQRAPDGTPVYYERRRPEQTTLYRLVQQHAATFIAETEMATGADLPAPLSRFRRPVVNIFNRRLKNQGGIRRSAFEYVRQKKIRGLAPSVKKIWRC